MNVFPPPFIFKFGRKKYNKYDLCYKNSIQNYQDIVSLPEKKHKEYLEGWFLYNTGETLDLRHPKTFNEKIQWLKLYDSTELKTMLTDKVKVRDWIKDQIGSEYLKPVLWIGKNFDDINFDELPESFIIKTNHGSKWHFVIKSKSQFLKTKELYAILKKRFQVWMDMQFWPLFGLELQYKNIEPYIIIEPLLIDANNSLPSEYEIYCFNGEPELLLEIPSNLPRNPYVYNKNFKTSDILLDVPPQENSKFAPESLKKAVILSKQLSKNFKLVRVDWIFSNNQLYFNEMTFTPCSGIYKFLNKENNIQLGKMLRIK